MVIFGQTVFDYSTIIFKSRTQKAALIRLEVHRLENRITQKGNRRQSNSSSLFSKYFHVENIAKNLSSFEKNSFIFENIRKFQFFPASKNRMKKFSTKISPKAKYTFHLFHFSSSTLLREWRRENKCVLCHIIDIKVVRKIRH